MSTLYELIRLGVAAAKLTGAETVQLFSQQGRLVNATNRPRFTHRHLLIKVLLFLLTAHGLLLTVNAANLTRQPSGTMAWLRSAYFLDSNRGWVVGSGGTLLQTSDAGNTWKRLLPLTRDTLHDVYFADENVGWLVAERNVLMLKTNEEPRSYLLKTEDGGFSWRRVFLNSSVNPRLVRMVFADKEHGWVFGESGVVFATNDGGAHWTRQPSPTKHLLLGGAFLNGSDGWLVGAGATIVQTRDGGFSWRSIAPREKTDARLTAASFVNSNLGWVVGAGGQIFTTRDGGRTWYAQKSNVDSDLLDVKFVNTAEGWVAGADGVLLHTIDGGAHWTSESTSTAHTLQRLFFIDSNHGWVVGFGGTILKYGQSTSPRLKS